MNEGLEKVKERLDENEIGYRDFPKIKVTI